MPRTANAATVVALAIFIFPCFIPTASSQRPGSITGKVYDAKNGAPLGYADVILVGTRLGAMALDDGRFVIEGVPPGVYTVKVMMMGYKHVERQRVIVDANQTVELDFPLEETIVAQVGIIEVYGKRPKIDVESSEQRHRVTEKEFKDLPIDDIVEALGLSSGVLITSEGYHVRGGRPDEVQTQIEGVLADDPLGGAPMDVGRLGAVSSELISGGMDAEYGNAQSGIIKIDTKEGGEVFSGEFRYMTDDFGRADKTYTNYDNVSLAFGGPTPWRHLRYYVSTEATFFDGEHNSIEPRDEHKLTSWLKARDRMVHELNLQGKLSWHRKPLKITGEAIVQRSRRDHYLHNWNVKGYVQRVHYFQRLRPTGTGQDVYAFGGITYQYEGPWMEKVNDPAQPPNPRPVTVEQLVRDPATGEQRLLVYRNFRALDVDGVTLLWDERIENAGVVSYKPWVLFSGYQFPASKFSHFQDDTSYVFFNAAERTPETKTNNFQLLFTLNHSLSDDLIYSLRLSRLEFNVENSVGGKRPDQYESAGMPTTLPDGTRLEGGITQAVWYTDEAHPYFVTAYDFPFYSKRNSVQYLFKSDVISEKLNGHRIKAGVQAIYNDLANDERAYPAERRRNPDGSVQQGRNVNLFHNFNTEGAAYVQDKWEYEGMVVNAGLRLEYFSTGNSDDILINNSEIDKTVEKYKYNWSPRLGVAFPISDRDKFFFHYGRFTQWPGRSYLFAPQDAIGALGPLGNPNLDPELTVSYQAGIAHQFAEDVVANFVVFYKDIYGLVSSTWVTDDSTGVRSRRWINKTYASSRGLEVGVEKSLTGQFGLDVSYTYSFADGVASDADFGRSAEGLTHLPTGELPLRWDQRHMVNVVLRLADRNNWGVTAIYQYGSGLPWTPFDRFARLQDPKLEHSRRHDATHRLRVQGRKNFDVYGRRLTLFFEGRNLLDQDIVRSGGHAPDASPPMVVAGMDNGSYLTETGRYGGAYLLDVDDDGRDDFVPVHDPTIWEEHRVWRIGLGFEF